jgi:hypothetical protein
MANPTSGPRKDDVRSGTTGTTGGFTDKARDAAAGVMDRAKDMASNAADTARDWASTAGQKASDAAGAVASGAASLAGTVRENLPGGESVAEAIESGTRYFQEHSFRDMADDVSNLIRRNPIPALLVGIGIGFLLARSTSRS